MPGWEEPWQALAAFAVGVAAGAANAVAGAGSTISFPTLVWLGLPAVEANATNAVGLWPGGVASVWGYRDRLRRTERRWLWLLVPSVVGGGLGAWLLIRLPPGWFETLAPFLVIGAALLVGVEPTLRRWVGVGEEEAPGWGRWLLVGGGAWLAISLYGGYFGAGIGILSLVTLALLGLHDLHRANALKNLLATAMKAAAVVYFLGRAVIVWWAAVPLLLGSVLGGYVAAVLIQRVEPRVLRAVVVGIGVFMGTLMLFRL